MPAQGRSTILDISRAKLFRSQIWSHMLALRRFGGFAPSPFQRGKGTDFRIQSIRITSHHGIRSVVELPLLKAANYPIDHLRIDQWTIGGDANNLCRFFRARRLIETIEDIVLAAPVTRNAILQTHCFDDVIRGRSRSGYNYTVHQP